jgi:class 3 adenylate cyclase
MAKLQKRNLSDPTDRAEIPQGILEWYSLGDLQVSRQVLEPGWRWSESVKPLAGTEWCEFHHIGMTLSGRTHVVTRDGAEMELGPEQFYEIPPGHDAWVVGDEPWVGLDWAPAAAFGRAAEGSAQRVVATLLFTDIVDSTVTARTLGDPHWRDQLARHNGVARTVIERFRGREMATTGDGFLVLLDGAERAVRAAEALHAALEPIGVRIRAGVHTGEVELAGDQVSGIAVHVAARVMAHASAGEVLVSWTTHDLLLGSTVLLEDLGPVELRGLSEPRRLYRVAGRR